MARDGGNTPGIVRYLAIVGLVLALLLVTLEPDVGFAAPPFPRMLFWSLQIAVGLVVLQSLLYLLTRRYGASRVPSWCLVLISGVLGAVVLAPVYWLIGEGLMLQWLGYPARPDEPGEDLLGVSFDNPLLAEYVDIVGPVTAAWALICLPRLHWLVPPLLHGRLPLVVDVPQPAPATDDSWTNRVAAVASSSRIDESPSEEASASPTERARRPSALPRPTWSARLPSELGTDVIAVASELQYLRVWTPRGCALVLGALADVETEDAARGLRVHRSWWVALDHVVSVRRTAAGATCVMSDGREVPVSRRRRAEVLARFGDGVRYRVAEASKAVSQTDLH